MIDSSAHSYTDADLSESDAGFYDYVSDSPSDSESSASTGSFNDLQTGESAGTKLDASPLTLSAGWKPGTLAQHCRTKDFVVLDILARLETPNTAASTSSTIQAGNDGVNTPAGYGTSRGPISLPAIAPFRTSSLISTPLDLLSRHVPAIEVTTKEGMDEEMEEVVELGENLMEIKSESDAGGDSAVAGSDHSALPIEHVIRQEISITPSSGHFDAYQTDGTDANMESDSEEDGNSGEGDGGVLSHVKRSTSVIVPPAKPPPAGPSAIASRFKSASTHETAMQGSQVHGLLESESCPMVIGSSDDDNQDLIYNGRRGQHRSANDSAIDSQDSNIAVSGAFVSDSDGTDTSDTEDEATADRVTDASRGLSACPPSRAATNQVRTANQVVAISGADTTKVKVIAKPVRAVPQGPKPPLPGYPSGALTTREPIPIGPPPLYPQRVLAKLDQTTTSLENQRRKRQQAVRSSVGLSERQVETGDRLHTCRLCGEPFVVINHLITHLRDKHGDEGSYPCAVCDKSFYTARAFRDHLKDPEAHVAMPPQPKSKQRLWEGRDEDHDLAGFSKPEPRQDQEDEADDRPQIARPSHELHRHCGCRTNHTYPTVQGLLKHRRDYHPAQPWMCTTCGQDFGKCGKLRIHLEANPLHMARWIVDPIVSEAPSSSSAQVGFATERRSAVVMVKTPPTRMVSSVDQTNGTARERKAMRDLKRKSLDQPIPLPVPSSKPSRIAGDKQRKTLSMPRRPGAMSLVGTADNPIVWDSPSDSDTESSSDSDLDAQTRKVLGVLRASGSGIIQVFQPDCEEKGRVAAVVVLESALKPSLLCCSVHRRAMSNQGLRPRRSRQRTTVDGWEMAPVRVGLLERNCCIHKRVCAMK